MLHQSLYDISEICYQLGVRDAVFSPGSRNAPLSISFSDHDKINTRVVVDERSAGFIALGIAQQTKRPVVICCTSGTALLNYGPAIAEAYYSRTPLVVLSADRPPEWINQWDGQTINQQNPFSLYTKGYFELPVDLDVPGADTELKHRLEEGILTARDQSGPVQINVPIREPFYPTPDQKLQYSDVQVAKISKPEIVPDHQALLDQWRSHDRKLIVVGQAQLSDEELSFLDQLCAEQNIPIIGDVISNVGGLKNVITHQNLFLGREDLWGSLEPDLVITLGMSLISKNLKLFLRASNCVHWHIDRYPEYQDPFRKLQGITQSDNKSALLALIDNSASQKDDFVQTWSRINSGTKALFTQIDQSPLTELSAFFRLMNELPTGINLHLSNSMPVRYANYYGSEKKVKVFANRGTSGIDGSSSTAVGHSLSDDRLNVLLTGDLSFLYDRNAFFNNFDLRNLRIVVSNNEGGGIFDMIKGPSELPKETLEKHFITPHSENFELIAQQFDMEYLMADNPDSFKSALGTLFKDSEKPVLLELRTDKRTNKKAIQKLKRLISQYEFE